MQYRKIVPVAVAYAATAMANAAPSCTVRGVVHDAAHRPIAGADIEIAGKSPAYRVTIATDRSGFFERGGLREGSYRIVATAKGFAPVAQTVALGEGLAPVLHFELSVATVHADVLVTEGGATLDSWSSATKTAVTRGQIESYAGASQVTSMRMITEFVPGAYMVHDQLHVRGGHQVTWALDGVPIPNTNIASNVGPQFDPKDVDTVEAQTGGYSAEFGDRTYGVFNVATRTGFERDREGELVATYGSFHSTDDQLSFGDHSERFAWYVSGSGHRTGYGLEPPAAQNLHNAAEGGSLFTSLLFNRTAKDQVRFDGAGRADFFEVPNTPEGEAAGVRDREREQDVFGILSWTHTLSPETVVELSPFYHFNRAAYEGGPADVPSATDNRASSYAGGQAIVSDVRGRSSLRAGIYAFARRDDSLFAVNANDGSSSSFAQRVRPGGQLEAAFLDEQWKLTPWWTGNAGLRLTHFAGALSENAADPRLGTAITLPRLGWVLRGSYTRSYQEPPLVTVSGPLLAYTEAQQLAFLPLRGERDEQHDVGLVIPWRGWSASFDYFRTGARNFFDHDAVGDSNLFLPLTLAHARIRGWEANVKSPLLRGRVHAHLVYSNQQAQGFGAVTGGLTDFSPPPEGGYYLDHDQRNTLAAGADGRGPWHTVVAFDLGYGSGFLDGDGPRHLPGYRTYDLSLGKDIAERLTVRAMATNLGNARYLLDNSNTFGGTHYGDPRMLSVEVRYRFHF